jgi:hypothetical protein
MLGSLSSNLKEDCTGQRYKRSDIEGLKEEFGVEKKRESSKDLLGKGRYLWRVYDGQMWLSTSQHGMRIKINKQDIFTVQNLVDVAFIIGRIYSEFFVE